MGKALLQQTLTEDQEPINKVYDATGREDDTSPETVSLSLPVRIFETENNRYQRLERVMSKRRNVLLVAVTLGLIVLVLFFTGVITTSPSTGSQNYSRAVKVSSSPCARPPGFVLIIASLSGFNDSVDHGAPLNPWPVIHVQQGAIVRILVCNEDETQAHGFAIQTYFDRGVALAPGDAVRIEFTATLPGSFTIYCNIFCTVHAFMVGRLVVSPSS